VSGRATQTLRRILSAICWTLAVIAGALTGAGFAGGGIGCQTGHRASCDPQTWILIVGILLTVGLGVAGAVLYRPPRKRPEPRFPWEMPK
jgi:hypothetical protein